MEINEVLLVGFKRWLETLGYAESTVYLSTHYVKDFFQWLGMCGVKKLSQVKYLCMADYHLYLQARRNKRGIGGLSDNYIASNINAIKRLNRYLQETGRPFLEVDIKTNVDKDPPKNIFTREEIKALYQACGNDVLGIRDRAILSVYYGCGLRRSEGVALDLEDVLLKEKRLYVRKGKNYKERYVPMTEAVRDDLENYIYVSRKKIGSFKNTKPEALFLNKQAKRMHGNSILLRVQKLAEKAGIDKQTGLHTLRHSIATHLLHSGMELEGVCCFLGHASLESTQIYTHVAHELENRIQL